MFVFHLGKVCTTNPEIQSSFVEESIARAESSWGFMGSHMAPSRISSTRMANWFTAFWSEQT